jgi:hypothetical protein
MTTNSGWVSTEKPIIPQKKVAQLTQSKRMIRLSLDHVGYVIADNRGHFIAVGGNRDILASFVGTQDTQLKIGTVWSPYHKW